MGDDLVDDWWVKEDIEEVEKSVEVDEKNAKKKKKKKLKNESAVEENDSTNVELKKKKKKNTHQDENINTEETQQTKKKKKLKRKAAEEAEDVVVPITTKKKKKKKKDSVIEGFEPTYESLWKFFQEELQKTLTSIEIEDIKPDTNDWFLEETEQFARDNLEQLSPYLKNVASSWEKRCSLISKKSLKGSPALLVLTSSALRAVDLLRHASSFKGDHKSVKLFAKHFKVEEQVKLLNENVVHLAVGTPHRILTLIENGSLKIEELKYLIVDWSWKDVKMRRILNMPNVKEDFILLFQKHFFELCQNGTLSVGLF